MFIRILLALAAAAMLTQGVALYGLASAHALAYLFGLAFMIFLFVSQRTGFSIVGSFFVVTLLIWGSITMLGLLGKNGQAPERILAAYDMELDTLKFRPDMDVATTQVSGDLGSITADPMVPRTPREVEFRTDSLGFRNNRPLAADDVILVGDGFIAGSGNTQADTLAVVLGREHGISAYSLGAPGDLYDYAVRVQAYAKEHTGAVYLFLFEGDDFGRYKDSLRPVLQRYARFMQTTDMGKFCNLQMEKLRAAEMSREVSILPLENISMAFYAPHVQESRRTECAAGPVFPVLIRALKDSVDGIFFIPTKYRVYAPLLMTNDATTLPDADWNALKAACAEAQIPCYNLTDALRTEAEALWNSGRELLWWPDDTHWNRNGIAVAARAIAELQKPAELPEPAGQQESEGVKAE
ncbi:hypothetical protein N1030_13325 [Desulfovibrio mangrovi]|uniref:alginate O-acetyltransferase AlgX-related protein n=1 Tax=Desulfovibrio mangrovi TaxID=2976983 RepID=UPI002245491B|nr:hypothetical protein [Desulfovibrio mangrovi]UZP66584.1 hypothetical protein N1030_13325 [Desulfovibrio mangrovi]